MDELQDDVQGLFIPLITPFTAAGDVDTSALRGLAERVLDDGAAGLVALGTTAETPTLSPAERDLVLTVCAQVCRERQVPLIAGVGSSDTAASVTALTDLAGRPEVTAALVAVPSYTRPGERGVVAHFRALAAASPLPVVVYHVPARTGQPVTWGALAELAGLPGIAGIKYATAAIDQEAVAMMAGRPGGFAVLGGDDALISPLLALGADGGILASAHIRTRDFARLIRCWRSGEAAAARQLGHDLVPVARALFAEPNPAVIKAVLHQQGEIASPAVRLPLLPASEAATVAVLDLLATAHPAGAARVA